MANTPEGKVKDEIKKVLKKYEPCVYYFMPVQNGMGKPGVDFHCSAWGRAFAIEAKAPGKKPTARQRNTLEEMKDAGMETFVIGCMTTKDGYGYSGLAWLDTWLASLERDIKHGEGPSVP